MMEEHQYPYTEYYGVESSCAVPSGASKVQISGFVKLATNNYTELMNAVASFGPIAVSVDANNFHAYDSGPEIVKRIRGWSISYLKYSTAPSGV